MMIYVLLLITIVLSLVIATYQKRRGLKFPPSFVKSFLAIAGIVGTIWKLLN